MQLGDGGGMDRVRKVGKSGESTYEVVVVVEVEDTIDSEMLRLVEE